MVPKVKLVSPEKAKLLFRNGAVPVDATWYMPNSPHNAMEQFQTERVKNAVFFDLDAVCCPHSKFPHMLPPHRLFEESVGKLGIGFQDPVVVYDRNGVFSGPRAAWTFALFGHPNVHLLDQFPESEFDLEKGPAPDPVPTRYKGIKDSAFSQNYRDQVIEFDELLDKVESGRLSEFVVFDARSEDRFTGKAPEPRPGLSSGHIPGALSLPFAKVLDQDGKYKSKEELATMFKNDYGLDFATLKKPVIVMCGTGVTAVILRLAIEKVANVPVRVYDGSWTEWAQRAPEWIVKGV